MTNTFIAALDCLTERGYPNALELANEIELNWINQKPPKRTMGKMQRLSYLQNQIFEIVRHYYPSYTRSTTIRLYKKNVGMVVTKLMPMTIDAVTGKCRVRDVAMTRFIIIHIIKQLEPRATLKDIGLIFGGRDHTTMIHSLRTLQDLLDVDKKLSAQYAEILDKVKSIVK